MTPKEKAKELFKRYIELTQEWDELDGYIVNKYNAKQCALISVDEILYWTDGQDTLIWLNDFYIEVKHEIEKL
jgi:ferritin-like protein